MEKPVNVDNKTDEELVELTLADQEYFLYITKRYKDKLYRYILRLTNIDPEEGEDILQDVFLKVYLNLNDFDTSLKFSSWIYRITHNQVISHHRKTKARPQGNSATIDDDEVKNIMADLDIEKEVDIGLLRENIDKVLLRLDDKYRNVLVLKYLEEKNYQEISDIIKRPMGTVATYLNKAKQEFKKELIKQKIKL
jgi:RNA polymerase sigma-70 factor (ECF subfamily)